MFHLIVPALSACGILWIQARAGAVLPPESARRLVSGAVCLAGLFSTINTLSYGVNDRRQAGAYEFLLAGGVSTRQLIAVELTVAVTFAVPPMAATAAFGAAELGSGAHLSFAFPMAIILFAAWSASVGILAGLLLPKAYVGLAATSLPLAAAVFTPVLLPPEALPSLLASVGSVLPSTIGAETIQAALHDAAIHPWWIAVILSTTIVSLAFAAWADQKWLVRAT